MEYTCELFGSGFLWWAVFILGLAAIMFMPSSKPKKDSTWEVLHKKFAEGALSVAEYEDRKAILERDKIKKR